MKYRQGFVSNSSSTSFVVAFVPEQDNLNLKTFDFLVSGQSNYNFSLKVFRATVKERREELNKELITIKRDREWLKDHISMLLECAEIPGIQILMYELDRSQSEREDLDYIRYKRRNKDKSWSVVITEHIQCYNSNIKKIDEKMKRIDEQLALISGLEQDTVVASWEISNGESLLTKLLSILKEDGRVVVLEELHT